MSKYTSFAARTTPRCSAAACGWASYPPYSFYAAWKYAQTFGAAASIFNAISAKLETPPTDSFLLSKPYVLNQYIAGYLGYLQLQQLVTGTQDSAIQATYNHLLGLRTNNFSKDSPFWGIGGLVMSPNLAYGANLNIARNFMYMTPELGESLNSIATASAKVKEAVDEYNYVAPYWFVSKFDQTVGEGTLQQLYNPSALFQAKAYILKEPQSELVKYIDEPAFARGDLFYIQNLTAALAAPATYTGPCTLSSLSWGSTTAITGDPVSLTARSSGDCSTTSVRFEVRRNGTWGIDDIAANIQPNNSQPVSFNSSDIASTSWLAENNPLIPGTQAEYYFRVSLDNGTTWNDNTLRPTLLAVSDAVVPTPTPTPTPGASTTPTPTPTPGGPTLDYAVNNDLDNGRWFNGSQFFGTPVSTLFHQDNTYTDGSGFFRFTGVQIPTGATITGAYLRLYGMGSGSQVNSIIRLVKQDNPTSPTSYADVIGRPRTTAQTAMNFSD
ncbi:hypothetical protein M1437_04165, partial [Patescibacteria group bacterium]|nr:hypothetical protein [Patescibacteria group bacterium]